MAKKIIHQPGERFGRLVLVERLPTSGNPKWLCQCDCGNVKAAFIGDIRRGFTTSCGCYSSEVARANNAKRLGLSVGDKFGRLTILEMVGSDNGKETLARCQCDCGAETTVPGVKLKSGNTKSCGCYFRQRIIESRTKHGKCRTRTYRIWASMMGRTTNPNGQDYRYYMGRGITVCDKWKSFAGFYEDMGECPDGMTIERVDNSLGYMKSNCVWASRLTQAQNTRTVKRIKIGGVTYPSVRQAALTLGVKETILYWALRVGKTMFMGESLEVL